jgi:hypothetical protein
MANKRIPDAIAGVDLHVLTRSPEGRTHKLLKTLAARGVKGVDEESLSMIDRFRLLASAYLTVTDAVNESIAGDAPEAEVTEPAA